MFTKSTWQHLRIPFSFFLMPIFLFAFAVSPEKPIFISIVTFLIIHFLLYPASNGYNSYFDKDEESIGGLRKPPPVSKELYYVSLAFDLIAILIGVLIDWKFALMLFIYGLISKAYSHPSIRLKKYAISGWFIAGLFQGFFTFIMVLVALNDFSWGILLERHILFPAILSSLFLWGSYPMTQVYQHKEDKERGDITISIKLGVLGTFHFTAVMFMIANAGFIYYFLEFSLFTALLFELFLLPVLIFFMNWYLKVRNDDKQANFDYTMKLNLLSSACLNLFFIVVTFFNLV